MNVLYTTLVILVVLCGSAIAGTCSNTVCGAAEQCCDEPAGAKCYNNQTYSCATNEKGEKLLCGYIGGNWYPAQACGSACYDEYEHSCCNGTLYSRFHTKGNPCLNPPGSIQPGCERCDDALSCCEDIHNGAQCYSPDSYVCLDNSMLCAIQNGVPNLSCGGCYNFYTHTCCGVLHSKQDRNMPCAPREYNVTLGGDWDIEIDFISNGFSSPGGTACGWTAQSKTADTYEMRNCTQWSGAGGFHYDENSYLISFVLPTYAMSYNSYELDLYIDNSNGKAQTAAIAVMDNDIPKSLNVTNSTLYTFPCNTDKLFAFPIRTYTLKIEAGFIGYKTIDVTPLAIWSFSTNPADHIQLLISSFSACSCADGNCCYEGNCAPDACSCSSSQYRFSIGGVRSDNHPKLTLTLV